MSQKIWLGTTSGDYSVAGNWSPSGAPAATDNVLIQGSVSITGGLNQSAVAIGEFIVDPGYGGSIGSVTGYLQINPTVFDFSGTGLAYIDLGASPIAPVVRNTLSVSTGFGLYLKGSALTTVTALKGSVALAGLTGETSSATTVNVAWTANQTSDANVYLGSGVTLTNFNQTGGISEARCAYTTGNVTGGVHTTRGAGAIGTLTQNGGAIYPQSTGTITTINANKGTLDFRRSPAARTVTNLNIPNPDTVDIYLDTNVVTLTNRPNPTGLIRLTVVQV